MIVYTKYAPFERETILNGKYSGLRENRQGVMLHYDASSTDAGAVAWFKDPRAQVSYQKLILDDGSYVSIAPNSKRAWHAGHCAPSDSRFTYRDANSAFYGVAIATNQYESATLAQIWTAGALIREYFHRHGWSPVNDLWRIVGHDDEAVYGPKDPRAGQRGRKIDPTGTDPKRPILRTADIRFLVSMMDTHV